MNKKCNCRSTGECVFEGILNDKDCELKKIDDELQMELLEIERNPPNLGNDIKILLGGNVSNEDKIKSVEMLIDLYELTKKEEERDAKNKLKNRRFKKGDIVKHKTLGIGEILTDGVFINGNMTYEFREPNIKIFLKDIDLICTIENRKDIH